MALEEQIDPPKNIGYRSISQDKYFRMSHPMKNNMITPWFIHKQCPITPVHIHHYYDEFGAFLIS
jgi:hypothetical protein